MAEAYWRYVKAGDIDAYSEFLQQRGPGGRITILWDALSPGLGLSKIGRGPPATVRQAVLSVILIAGVGDERAFHVAVLGVHVKLRELPAFRGHGRMRLVDLVGK